MGNIIKIGEDYFIEFFARGLRYRRMGGKTKDEAQKLLDEIEGKIELGELSIVTHEIAISRFLDQYMQSVKTSYSARSWNRINAAAGHFKGFCERALSSDAKLSEVTPGIIEEYRAHLTKSGAKPRLINFTIIILRSILHQSINEGYLNDNPTFHTKFVEDPKKIRPRLLSQQEWGLVIESADKNLADILRALKLSGMKLDELISLKWENIDFAENCLNIGRKVPISGELLQILRARHSSADGQTFVFVAQDGKQLTKEALIDKIEPTAKHAGLSGCLLLSALRNNFAYDVLNRGVPIIELHRLLGLGDIARIMKYSGYITGKTL